MSAKLDEFKEFVKRHPLLKGMVQSKQKTWQELYEDYCILGESAFPEEEKEEKKEETKKETKSSSSTEDLIKTVVGYVKKIDPDQVTKTVTSIQKVLELFGGIGGAAAGSALAKKSTGDPLFDKRFDEWY
ncbi:MAG: YlbD family protein [Anaeroplasmataceae bacterium]|nr:YlbD family protein [Anaeroplasmataceae bacterium]MDE7385284.1 YlbD family protein [Anaeroplasmataceae bacterium]